jgi:hypothetical protein
MWNEMDLGARVGGRKAPPAVNGLVRARALSLFLLLACSPGTADRAMVVATSSEVPVAEPTEFHVPPPPFSEGVFPCSDCHNGELPTRTKRRTLRVAHQEIVLQHDEQNRWCLDCHDVEDRDVLHLASGERISFEESYRLCGQCHGDKYRDWRAGVHGRRSGQWDGEKQYLLCVHCHNAHSPRFQPIPPEPTPIPPKRTE